MIRVLLRCLLALAGVAASTLVGWRVLAPAELLHPAATAYPPLPKPVHSVVARMNEAPLIVDGRLRVFAAKSLVIADNPVNAKAMLTPRWSFRRWPQQLNGVVAVGRTVVTRWSDGDLIAISAVTGKIVWRTTGAHTTGYGGYRTGAATVWSPPGLHTSGGDVVIASGQTLSAYAASTGTRLWSVSVPAGCTNGFTTAAGDYVCATGAYDGRTGQAVVDFPSGPFSAVACDVARSDCQGLRDGSGQGWLMTEHAPSRLTALDHKGATIAAGYVFYLSDGGLQSVNPKTGAVRTYPAGQVLGSTGGRVIILLRSLNLFDINPATGETLADYRLSAISETKVWKLGQYAVFHGHVAIERLRYNGSADPTANGHYLASNSVVLAGA